MKKLDLSIHFTLKDQSIIDIEEKTDKWLEGQTFIDFSEQEIPQPLPILHHCFLPREVVVQKGFATDVVDMLDQIAGENQVRWFGVSENLPMSRLLMLTNLKRVNGMALFVGEIKEGVKEEWDLAQSMGIDCICI